MSASVAVVLYLAVAVVWSWPLATQPGSAITELTDTNQKQDSINHYDRLLTIAGTARNSSALVHDDPGKLLGTGLCYPHPFAGTLGEHMIELGILAAPFRIVTDNPVALHNATLLTSFLISGLAMFAAVFYWTGSGAAAIVAGLALAVHPERLMNLAHPTTVAVHWVPLVLIFFDRLLEKGRARDAVLLAVTASLQSLTGSYPLLTFGLIAFPYGIVRLFQQRSRLNRYKVSLLGTAVLATLALTAAVIVPYLRQDAIWRIAGPRLTYLVSYGSLFFGRPTAIGITTLALALFAVACTIRCYFRPGKPPSPKGVNTAMPAPVLALILSAVSCAAFAAHGPLWQGGPSVPSIYKLLRIAFPPLGSIRAPGATALGAVVSAVGLAGIGLALLLRPLRTTTRAVATAVAGLLILAETFAPMLAGAVYGRSWSAKLRKLAPLETTLSEYEVFDNRKLDGPVLDLPFADFLHVPRGASLSAEYTFLAAFHGQPTAACYNSFLPPSYFDVIRMAAMLPMERGIEELGAAGLRNLVIHTWQVPRGFLNQMVASPNVKLLRRSKTAAALRITKVAKTHSLVKRLSIDTARVPVVLSREAVSKAGLPRYASFSVTNHADIAWALPHPLHPLDIHVRWIDIETGEVRKDNQRKAMLPLALSPASTGMVPLELLPLPLPGKYRLEIQIPDFGRTITPQHPVSVIP